MKAIFRGVSAWENHGEPGDIIDADFLEFYRKDVFEMMEEDPVRAICLIGNLPSESRLATEELGGKPLSLSDDLLIMLEYYAHSWLWSHSEDGKRKINQPEPLLPDYILEAQALASEQREEILQTPEEIREFIYGSSFN